MNLLQKLTPEDVESTTIFFSPVKNSMLPHWKARLGRILPRVERPGRYVGGEVNAVRKDWDATPTRVCLIF
ncbi:MAG: hypothetical protein ACPLTQ_12975, partial [Anaerolineae bacterium]